MKILATVIVFAMFTLGCSGEANKDNTREIHKDARSGGAIPFDAMDEALQTEARMHMAAIHRQVRVKAIANGGSDSFYRSISGRLDSGKLAKLGISASDLKGTNYQAGDYNLSFSGKTMTITASAKGTRGYVATDSYAVP